jgi:hypothetical protein
MGSHTKRLTIAVATIAVALTIIGCTDSTEVSGPDKLGSRYLVDFPATPKCSRVDTQVAWAKVRRELCVHFDGEAGRGYSSEIFTVPDGNASVSPADLLMAAASGAASNSDSEIVSSNTTTAGAYPALDVTLFPKTKGFVAFSRYVLAGNELITVTADGYKTREIPADASAFLSSVRVLP